MQDDDAVGVQHGGEAVRDHQAGSGTHQLLQRLLNLGLDLGVDGARGLVQDEYARIEG